MALLLCDHFTPIRSRGITRLEQPRVSVNFRPVSSHFELGKTNAPPPNPDLPDDVKKEYEEAASIYIQSPRGAAALLRLAIQKLCIYLGGSGENINNDIATLVKNGLPITVQQALDVVRVTGNNAVHPGQIDTDDIEIAGNLFPLVNVIVEYTISIPNRIKNLYDNLPEGAKSAIEKRDSKGRSNA